MLRLARARTSTCTSLETSRLKAGSVVLTATVQQSSLRESGIAAAQRRTIGAFALQGSGPQAPRAASGYGAGACGCGAATKRGTRASICCLNATSWRISQPPERPSVSAGRVGQKSRHGLDFAEPAMGYTVQRLRCCSPGLGPCGYPGLSV